MSEIRNSVEIAKDNLSVEILDSLAKIVDYSYEYEYDNYAEEHKDELDEDGYIVDDPIDSGHIFYHFHRLAAFLNLIEMQNEQV